MEAETQALARRLLEAAGRREPLALSPDWWQRRMLEWATADPDFRIKLLRFVDVLPTLRSARAVSDHIRQYFRGPAPAIVQMGSGLASQVMFRPVVSRIVREGVYAMADRFIAGASPKEAVPRLADLATKGIGYTVDLLGEATVSEAEADVYLQRYTDLIETLARDAPGPSGALWEKVPPVNISIKLTALYSQLEPAAPEAVSAGVRTRLRPLLRTAVEQGAFVNVDMEQYRYRDIVHSALTDALREPYLSDFTDVGTVVQAYLRDSLSDIVHLRALAEERGSPITVRLVKGAYWEEERIVASQNSWRVPVYDEKEATDYSFERCTDALLDAWPHLLPAFGTHNPRSIAQAIIKARARGLDDGALEFQMLFGMAEELREAVAAEGFRTRVYVPVGEVIPGMAYLVRRLLENTSNQSWFIREETAASPDEVVAPPRPPQEREPAAEAAVSNAGFRNAPPAEFYLQENRQKMRQALDGVRADFGRTYPLMIGRDRVEPRELAEVTYPAEPALLLGRVGQATGAELEAAVESARRGFTAWRDRAVHERTRLLRRAAEIMEKRRFELAATMVFESAKPWHEADGDVVEAIDYLRYYADQAERLGVAQSIGDVLGEENFYLHEGRGVAAIIAPWNFPLAIITGMSSAALVAGNAAILKPAAQSPIIAYKLVEIYRQAGIPAEVVHYLPGQGSVVGRQLAEHPQVDTIAFTGSKEVGLGIIRAAAETPPNQRNVKRVIAEMGGKNAIIVDDDADLDQAVSGVVISAFGYAGQKCSACSRLIVLESAYEEMMGRLGPAVESLIVGPPHEPWTFVPPVISESACRGIEGYIAAGMASARLFVQGSRPETPGHYVAPTVFVDVDPDDALARDEIFGPVLSVFRARDFEEALLLALDSQFALTGGVYSRNPRNIERAKRSFRVGNLYLNRKVTGAVVGRQPFGGLRMSGVGDKAGGPDYLLQFMEPRTVTENTMRRGFAPEGLQFFGTRP
jgi:RHH-type transcriptional regulator, proline utilization regulon repressor / proline dehydrogenase / delta 1-pyrroline-5-carboxylate dehydrogenase